MANMIKIKGKEVSEDTIALALMQYFTKHPEKYVFRAGDVVEYNGIGRGCGKRIIVRIGGVLHSVRVDTGIHLSHTQSQRRFEECEYRKIGVLSDYIK
ncbi:hypothetical protein LCGC14_0916040 [marine sediment metagenome]|uniref:Uncharacterized protein n=1 Tax=marine sediment metagenome TaxID=412755 RepID=A0A0F9RYY2_9ZZZZ